MFIWLKRKTFPLSVPVAAWQIYVHVSCQSRKAERNITGPNMTQLNTAPPFYRDRSNLLMLFSRVSSLCAIDDCCCLRLLQGTSPYVHIMPFLEQTVQEGHSLSHFIFRERQVLHARRARSDGKKMHKSLW